jgi:hypothetical protein
VLLRLQAAGSIPVVPTPFFSCFDFEALFVFSRVGCENNSALGRNDVVLML